MTIAGCHRQSSRRDALNAFRASQDVSVQSLMVVPDLLRGFGVDPTAVLRRARVDPQWMKNPGGHIPFDVAHRIASECVKATGCPHFGLLVGQRVGTMAMGILAELSRHSTDVRSALRMLSAHLHVQDRGGVVFVRHRSTREVEFVYLIHHPEAPGRDVMLDVALPIMVAFMRGLCGRDWAPSEIAVSHSRPRDVAPYRAILGARIRFDAPRTALIFPKRWLIHRIAGARLSERRRLFKAVAEVESTKPASLTEYVVRALVPMVLDRAPTGDSLARALGVSHRTLRRRLAAEGTSVKALIAEVRGEIARQLLAETRMPVHEIGETLCYAAPSVFSRAFKGWTGKTPQGYRTAAIRRRASKVGGAAR